MPRIDQLSLSARSPARVRNSAARSPKRQGQAAARARSPRPGPRTPRPAQEPTNLPPLDPPQKPAVLDDKEVASRDSEPSPQAVICAVCPSEYEDVVHDVCKKNKIMKAFGRGANVTTAYALWRVEQWEAQVVTAVIGLVEEREAKSARIICIDGAEHAREQKAAQQHLIRMVRVELGDAAYPVRLDWLEFEKFVVEFPASGGGPDTTARGTEDGATSKLALPPTALATEEDAKPSAHMIESPSAFETCEGTSESADACTGFAAGFAAGLAVGCGSPLPSKPSLRSTVNHSPSRRARSRRAQRRPKSEAARKRAPVDSSTAVHPTCSLAVCEDAERPESKAIGVPSVIGAMGIVKADPLSEKELAEREGPAQFFLSAGAKENVDAKVNLPAQEAPKPQARNARSAPASKRNKSCKREPMVAVWSCADCHAYFTSQDHLRDHQQSEGHWNSGGACHPTMVRKCDLKWRKKEVARDDDDDGGPPLTVAEGVPCYDLSADGGVPIDASEAWPSLAPFARLLR